MMKKRNLNQMRHYYLVEVEDFVKRMKNCVSSKRFTKDSFIFLICFYFFILIAVIFLMIILFWTWMML